MNERIQLLAKQAGIIGQSEGGIAPPTERFAESIVEECARVARQHILGSSGVDPHTYTGVALTEQRIREHFGLDVVTWTAPLDT